MKPADALIAASDGLVDIKSIGFKLVYQGGRHDVWCDGESHITLCGDGYGKHPISSRQNSGRLNAFRCDCAKYRT